MIIDASHGSPNIKPPMWATDPGVVAHNASKLGLPMPKGYQPVWENAGLAYDVSGNQNNLTVTGSWEQNGVKCGVLGEYLYRSNFISPGAGTIFMKVKKVEASGNSGEYAGLFNVETAGNDSPCEMVLINYSTFRFYPNYDQDPTVRWNFGSGIDTLFPLGIERTITITWDHAKSEIVGYLDGVQTGTREGAGWVLNSWTAGENSYFGAVFSSSLDLSSGCIILDIYAATQALISSQVAILSADPYGLVWQPSMEELWAYYEAVVGVAPTGVLYGPLFGPLGGPI